MVNPFSEMPIYVVVSARVLLFNALVGSHNSPRLMTKDWPRPCAI